MQPMMEYYPSIYMYRHHEDETVGRSNRGPTAPRFWHRLSQLSKMIFAGIIALMVACACLFSLIRWKYFFLFACVNVVLSGLFVVVLGYCWNHPIHCILSIDALIKYFASGFFLSASFGIFWEFLVVFIFQLTIKLLFRMDGTSSSSSEEEKENGYQYYYSLAMTSTEEASSNNYGGYSLSEANFFWMYYSKDHLILSAIILLIKSFCVTAIIEELCKYFGYRMVDHPDFYNRQKLEQAASASTSVGGRPKLSFSRQDSATLMAKGSAITFAMVATALGFACCQNIVYYIIIVICHSAAASTVFVVATRSILVLFVHTIAAAIQSIGVCKRDIEKDDTIQVGRIILPSIIFCGVYDFLMTWIDTHDAKYQTKVLLSTLTVSIGLCFYLWRASVQQKRLESLDPANTSRSPIIDFWNKDTKQKIRNNELNQEQEGKKQNKRRWSWFRKKKNQSVK